MMRIIQRSLLAALGLATALSACSAGPLGERVPESLGGLPAGVPTRPVTPYQYPAVHDMPPARATTPLSEEAQFKLEKELRAARDRQEAEQGRKPGQGNAKKAGPADKKTAPVTKRQSGDANIVPPAGAKTSGGKTNP